MCRGSRCLSGLSLRQGWGAGVSSPDFGHAWAWTWQLLLPPGDTPAHFSTLAPNNKGLKVDCWGSTKDKIVLGRRGSWLLLPAVGSPSAHVAGGAGTPGPRSPCSVLPRSKIQISRWFGTGRLSSTRGETRGEVCVCPFPSSGNTINWKDTWERDLPAEVRSAYPWASIVGRDGRVMSLKPPKGLRRASLHWMKTKLS